MLQKIKRMASEIYENNYAESEIILAGIHDKGYLLAQMLIEELNKIAPFSIKLAKVTLDKGNPYAAEAELDLPLSAFANQCVIVVDDVLNTGKTLIYALRPLLKVNLKKIEIAVLVNRSHTQYPVWPAYSGYALSTTLTEHVEVVFAKEKSAVYLH